MAAEGRLARARCHPLPNYGEAPAFAGVSYQHAKVTPDSFSDAPFHQSHSEHGVVRCQPTGKENPGHSGYDPDVSASVLDLSETDSETAAI